MNIGPFQILIILLVVVLLFGRGRISDVMGDFGKGVKSFRKEFEGDEGPPSLGSAETPPLSETAEAPRPDSPNHPG